MTVSAAVRLIPCPPARVDRRKANTPTSGSLNWSIRRCRSSVGTLPSMRTLVYPTSERYRSRMLSMSLNCEKISTLWPCSFNLGRSRCSSSSFPDAPTRSCSCASRETAPAAEEASWAESKRYAWLQHLRSSISMLSSDTRRFCLSWPLRILKFCVRHAA